MKKNGAGSKPAKGRPAGKAADADVSPAELLPEKPPEKPQSSPPVGQCTRFMQRRVAAHLPGILEQLLKKSRGDAATLKALWQMSKLDEQTAAPRKRKGSLAREVLRNG